MYLLQSASACVLTVSAKALWLFKLAVHGCSVSKCRPVFPLQVIHVTGRLRIRMALTHSRSVPVQIMGMVVVAHALPPPTINEVRIDCQMFVTRVNMDLKIVYCENRYGVVCLVALLKVWQWRCVGFCSVFLQK